MTAIDSATALKRLACHGLPGVMDDSIAVDSLDQLLIRADTQRVLAHVYRAVRSGAVQNASSDWVDRLRDRLFSATETTLAAHAAAMLAGQRLQDAGIRTIVLKGCATGPLDYAHAADRFSSDVDLLVAHEDRDAALACFPSAPIDVVRRRRWHERYGHASTIVGPTGVELDVHVRVNHGYVGLAVPTAELFDNTERFDIGGHPLESADTPNRLLLAAVHADGPHCSLHALRDVPQLVLSSAADWREAVERSERWRVDSFFASGVTTAWSAFALEPHPIVDWAKHHRSRGRQRVLNLIPGGGVRRQVLAGPLALSPVEWPRYVAPLLMPSREYVSASGKTWRDRAAIVRGEVRRDDRRSDV